MAQPEPPMQCRIGVARAVILVLFLLLAEKHPIFHYCVWWQRWFLHWCPGSGWGSSLPFLVHSLNLCDASPPALGSSLTCWILEGDSAGLWVLSLCNSLFSSTGSDVHGSLGLPRLSAPSFPLQDLYTLAPPPCVEIWGSVPGQSEGSLSYFPFSHGSLSFATWYPISLKLFFHILAYFAFVCVGGGLSKKVNLVLVTLIWMEMEVCGLSFFSI